MHRTLAVFRPFRRSLRLSFYIVAFVLGFLQPRLSAQRPDAFALGVVRRDGLIVPFAAFDGKRWSNAWPPPQFQLEIPINLQSVPKSWWGPTGPLSEWQFWSPGAAAGRPVHITQPDWLPTHCLRQIALKSDYKSSRPAPALTEQPYPKDGLAISSALTLEKIDVVPAGGAAAEALAGSLREKFNEAELDVDRRFGHPIPRKVREPIAPVIEALYGFGEGARTYYIEASRTYRIMGDKECRIAFATGWFTRQPAAEKDAKPEQTRWLDIVVDLLPCNKYGATYMLPFGVVRAGGRAFWIAQYAGWDHERYVVIELKKNAVEAVVSAWGGGC